MRNKLLTAVTAIIVVAMFGATSAFGATHTWDGEGGDGNFSTNANWVGDTDVSAAFAAGDLLVFPNFNYAGANQPVADESYVGIAAMTFDTTGSTINLTFGADLTMQAAGLISVAAGGGNGVTFTAGAGGIIAAGALTIDNDDAGGLAIAETITGTGTGLISFTGAENITVTGIITDSGSNNPVTINMDAGADVVALNAANTFAGLLTITQGTATLGNAQGFGTGAGGISLGGGILHVNTAINAAAWTPTVTLTAPSTIDVDAATEIDTAVNNGGVLLTVTGGNSVDFQGAISGAGGLTANMDGAAVVVKLSADNAYTGTTTLTQGRLTLNNANAVDATTAMTLTAGVLDIDTGVTAANWAPNITMGGPVAINCDAASEIDGTINNGGNNLTISGTENLELSGIVSGGGALIMNMTALADVLTLSGANTYTGATTCTVGTLNVQHATGTGTVAGGVSVAVTNASLQLEGGITVGAEALTLNGDGAGTIELENVSGSNTWGGAVTLATGTVDIQSTAGTLTLGSTISCGGQNLEFEGAGNTIVTGAIGPAAATTLTKNGAGTLQLNAVNTYTGLTTVSAGTLAGTCTIDGAVTVAAGANLSPGASLGGAVGTMTIDGTVTLNGESKYLLSVEGGASDTINVTTGNFTATLSAPNIELETGYNPAGLALPSTVINLSGGGAYTALDESALPTGWDIDDAKVGNLIRLTAVGTAAVPTLNEWGMIITMILLAATAVMAMRRRRAGMHVA